MSNTWKPNGVPFCWMPKEAMRRIEQNLEQSEAAMAKLVYLALARIASDESSGSFQKPIAYVATLASVGRRTVERRLRDLERLGLVTITRGELHVSHHYQLATPSRNDATQTEPLPVALSRELEKKGGGEPGKPITTAQRIGLENTVKILREKIIRLDGELHYAHDRARYPGKVAERERLKGHLAETEAKLLEAGV